MIRFRDSLLRIGRSRNGYQQQLSYNELLSYQIHLFVSIGMCLTYSNCTKLVHILCILFHAHFSLLFLYKVFFIIFNYNSILNPDTNSYLVSIPNGFSKSPTFDSILMIPLIANDITNSASDFVMSLF